jgi:hypothetical protein
MRIREVYCNELENPYADVIRWIEENGISFQARGIKAGEIKGANTREYIYFQKDNDFAPIFISFYTGKLFDDGKLKRVIDIEIITRPDETKRVMPAGLIRHLEKCYFKKVND